MNNRECIHLLIQAEPNSLAIDFARITLDEDVLIRLRALYGLLDTCNLLSVSALGVSVHWFKKGAALPDIDSVCEVFEGGVGLSAHFHGEPNAKGIFGNATTVSGVWILGNASDLEMENLQAWANENGEIYAESLGSSCLDQVSNSALLQYARHHALRDERAVMSDSQFFDWPNPYERWTKQHIEESSSHRLLPREFQTTERTFTAETVLKHLLHLAIDPNFDPNHRCALYSLAAALIICPQEVTLQYVDKNRHVPDFLLSAQQILHRNEKMQELTEVHFRAHEDASKRVGVCGNCLAEFPKQPLVVQLTYADLQAELEVEAADKAKFKLLNSPRANLALLYEDHLNNCFAHQLLVDFLGKYSDDFSRLKMLAFGLDALKRLLPKGYPWREDLKLMLQNPDMTYQ
jgi:hypothetical protein